MTKPTSVRRILAGIRVVDLTQFVAGPYSSRMLADLGADVVRIEPPARSPMEGHPRTEGSPSLNLGKKSISLDIKHAGGLEVARRLIDRADVLLENYRPGVLPRLGIGYEDVSRTNPGIVYASISGFGQDTSYSHRRAFGATAQAEAGWIWVQQMAQGGQTPFTVGVSLADMLAGMHAFSAILAALYDRVNTGRGQRIDISLMDSQLALLSEVSSEPLRGQSDRAWQPFRHGLQEAKDGYISVNIGVAHNWCRIAAAFGHADLPMPADPREASQLISKWVSAHSVEEAALLLEKAGAPYGVVKSMYEALAHPYFAERGMIVEVPDPIDHTAQFVRSPLFFSEASSAPMGGPPLAGQHTRDVLADLGYDADRIEELLRMGVASHQALE